MIRTEMLSTWTCTCYKNIDEQLRGLLCWINVDPAMQRRARRGSGRQGATGVNWM